MKTQYIRDLKEKEAVDSTFLVKTSAILVGKNGKSYMNVVLVDKTGEIECRIWDQVTEYSSHAVRDNFVRVTGKVQMYQNRKQLVIDRLQLLREDEIDPKDFVVESFLDVDSLYGKLRAQIESMQDPDYRALAESVFLNDAEAVSRLKRAPAAKSVHHAYPGGLIEHVVSINDILIQLHAHYAAGGVKMNRDLLLIGGLFHDIGKLWELSYERTTDYTTEGRLIGHLVMGVELIERNGKALKMPEMKRMLAKHMVLAHHGKLEYGSPKEPHCVEALVVHMIDDLDSKVNAISRFIEMDQTPGEWTALNRMHERFFYKSPN